MWSCRRHWGRSAHGGRPCESPWRSRLPPRCRRTVCRGPWSPTRAFPTRPPWSCALISAGRRGGPAERASNLRFDRADPAANALTPDENDGDEQQADPELPVARREIGQIVLQQPVDQGADEAAIKIAGAADDEDQENVGRALNRKHGERSEGLGLGQQTPGDPGVAG